MERISVLMGIYNCAETLSEALDSLYAQTYQDFKIILCDDGSTDNTYEVAKTYADKHNNIVLIANECNKGLNFTLNHCLEYADTEFVARMDGDDISMPERFAIEVKFLDEHPEYGIVSTPCTYFDKNGIFRKGVGQGEVKKMQFLRRPPLSHAPCMARTEVFKKVGGYSVSPWLIRVEDYHLWFKIYASGTKMFQMHDSYYLMRDNRDAKLRRTWRSRFNEVYVKHIGYKMIGIPWYYQIFAIEPLVRQALPDFLYQYLRRRRK
jgi:glycosyltransferase EpsE